MKTPKNITFFQRKPYDFHFSIEKLFDTIRENISVDYYTFILPYFSIGFLPRLKSALIARRHQGSINHIEGDIHFITPFLSKKRTINTYHDFTFLKNASGLSRFVLWFFWVYIPVLRSKYITVISEVTKQELIKYTGCKKDKIKVIPNIISDSFQFSSKTLHAACPIILHIGTTPNKNLHRLIEAIRGIKCQLVIVGKLSDETQELLNANSIYFNNVFQISEQELQKCYVNCDILSFCSLNEGFGLPILEAQATGRPVVTSNLSSMPVVAGEAACLVNPYDVQSIKQGIMKVIEDKAYREELVSTGLENVKRFNPKVVAGMYEALYQKIYNELQN